MKYWWPYLFMLMGILFNSCSKDSNPLKEKEYEYSTELFNKFVVQQTYFYGFSVKSDGKIVLPDTVISSIVYSEMNGSFSAEIPFNYTKVEGGFSLNFNYQRKGVATNNLYGFDITYLLKNNEAVKIDSSIFLFYLSKDDMEIILDIEDLGPDFQDNSYYYFDVSDSNVIFSTWSPEGTYAYNFYTQETNQLLSHSITRFAANEHYLFYYSNDNGIFRYRLDSLKRDLNIDLSQLEYEIKHCLGMYITSDTLAVTFMTDLDYMMRIAYFNIEGIYLSTYVHPQRGDGFDGDLAIYGNLIFMGSDTGWFVYDFIKDYYYIFSIDNFGPGFSNIRIKSDGYFYCMDWEAKFIGKVHIERILEVLF